MNWKKQPSYLEKSNFVFAILKYQNQRKKNNNNKAFKFSRHFGLYHTAKKPNQS